MKAYLIPYPIESFSKPILLSPEKTSIGRVPGNEIVIPHQTVSRQHARIVQEGDRYYLVDMKSRNGTRLNAKKIRKERLKHHDKISIGNKTFQFLLQSGAEGGSDALRLSNARDTVVIQEDTIDFSGLLAQEAAYAAHDLFEPSKLKPADPAELSHKARKYLSMLYQLSEKLRASSGIDEIIDVGLDLILETIPSAERSILMLKSASNASMEIKAVKYREETGFEQDMPPVSRTLLDWVLAEKMVLVSQDVEDDARFETSDSIRLENVRSIICAPMMRALLQLADTPGCSLYSRSRQ